METIPKTRIAVRIHRQEWWMYCGPAVAQMMLEQSWGICHDQTALFAQAHPRDPFSEPDRENEDGEPVVWESSPTGLAFALSEFRRQGEDPFVVYRAASAATLLRLILWKVSRGEPCATLIGDPGSTGGELHWVLVHGARVSKAPASPRDATYKVESVRYFDPSPPLFADAALPGLPPPHHRGDGCVSSLGDVTDFCEFQRALAAVRSDAHKTGPVYLAVARSDPALDTLLPDDLPFAECPAVRLELSALVDIPPFDELPWKDGSQVTPTVSVAVAGGIGPAYGLRAVTNGERVLGVLRTTLDGNTLEAAASGQDASAVWANVSAARASDLVLRVGPGVRPIQQAIQLDRPVTLGVPTYRLSRRTPSTFMPSRVVGLGDGRHVLLDADGYVGPPG